MKLTYEYTKKDLIKYLFKSRIINNIILFVLLMLIYIIFLKGFNLLLTVFVIFGAIILINILYVVLYIYVNKKLGHDVYGKYTLELDKNKFSLKLNKKKVEYKYSSIKKVKECKNLLKIKFKKSREFLTFEKRLFNKKDYNNLVKAFKEKTS